MRMIRYGFLLFCCLTITLVQADSIDQKTQGWCSPAVNKTGGNVEIHCHDVSPKIVKRLEELLDKKDVDLINAKTEIDHWLTKYNELKTQLAKRPATDELAAKAKALLDNGELEAAEQLLKKSLAQNLAKRIQQTKEKESLDLSTACDAYDLGTIKELQLDYPTAETYYKQAAEIAPNNTYFLKKVGMFSYQFAAYKKAIGYFEQALASDLKTYGEDHLEVATLQNNLGLAWWTLGESQKAIEYLELALTSDLKTNGEDHPAVARDRNNLGLVWWSLGKYQKAMDYFTLALTSDLQTCDKDGQYHPIVATLQNNLGLVWNSLGESQKAIEYSELALASDLKSYGEDHSTVARDRRFLGMAWHSLGRYQKAIEFYTLALASDLKTYGKDHPGVAHLQHILGAAWQSLGEYTKAIEYYTLALATFEEKIGIEHPIAKTVRNNLAVVKEKLAQTETDWNKYQKYIQ